MDIVEQLSKRLEHTPGRVGVVALEKLQETLQKSNEYQALEIVREVVQDENIEKDLKMKPPEISHFK